MPHHRSGAVPPPVVINVHGPAPVQLPNADLLLDADYSRHGDDLVLIARDGHEIIIHNYFGTDHPPSLMAPGGVVVDATLAARLAGPLTPGQYAQAGGDSALGAPIGKVDKIGSGGAEVKHADGTVGTLHQGDPVFHGDQIRTSEQGSIGMTMADGTEMSLGALGRLVLDDLAYDPSAHTGDEKLTLLQGTFSFVSGQISKTEPDAFTIQTPTTTVGIRGTAGVLDVAANGATIGALLAELGGAAGEMSLGGAVLNVPGLSATVATPGGAAGQVVAISAQQIGEIFGSALAALPNAAAHIDPATLGPATQSFQQQQQQQQLQQQEQQNENSTPPGQSGLEAPAADPIQAIANAIQAIQTIQVQHAAEVTEAVAEVRALQAETAVLVQRAVQVAEQQAIQQFEQIVAQSDAAAVAQATADYDQAKIDAEAAIAAANTAIGYVTGGNNDTYDANIALTAALSDLQAMDLDIARVIVDAAGHPQAQVIVAELGTTPELLTDVNAAAYVNSATYAVAQAEVAVAAVSADNIQHWSDNSLIETRVADDGTLATDSGIAAADKITADVDSNAAHTALLNLVTPYANVAGAEAAEAVELAARDTTFSSTLNAAAGYFTNALDPIAVPTNPTDSQIQNAVVIGEIRAALTLAGLATNSTFSSIHTGTTLVSDINSFLQGALASANTTDQALFTAVESLVSAASSDQLAEALSTSATPTGDATTDTLVHALFDIALAASGGSYVPTTAGTAFDTLSTAYGYNLTYLLDGLHGTTGDTLLQVWNAALVSAESAYGNADAVTQSALSALSDAQQTATEAQALAVSAATTYAGDLVTVATDSLNDSVAIGTERLGEATWQAQYQAALAAALSSATSAEGAALGDAADATTDAGTAAANATAATLSAAVAARVAADGALSADGTADGTAASALGSALDALHALGLNADGTAYTGAQASGDYGVPTELGSALAIDQAAVASAQQAALATYQQVAALKAQADQALSVAQQQDNAAVQSEAQAQFLANVQTANSVAAAQSNADLADGAAHASASAASTAANNAVAAQTAIQGILAQLNAAIAPANLADAALAQYNSAKAHLIALVQADYAAATTDTNTAATAGTVAGGDVATADQADSSAHGAGISLGDASGDAGTASGAATDAYAQAGSAAAAAKDAGAQLSDASQQLATLTADAATYSASQALTDAKTAAQAAVTDAHTVLNSGTAPSSGTVYAAQYAVGHDSSSVGIAVGSASDSGTTTLYGLWNVAYAAKVLADANAGTNAAASAAAAAADTAFATINAALQDAVNTQAPIVSGDVTLVGIQMSAAETAVAAAESAQATVNAATSVGGTTAALALAVQQDQAADSAASQAAKLQSAADNAASVVSNDLSNAGNALATVLNSAAQVADQTALADAASAQTAATQAAAADTKAQTDANSGSSTYLSDTHADYTNAQGDASTAKAVTLDAVTQMQHALADAQVGALGTPSAVSQALGNVATDEGAYQTALVNFDNGTGTLAAVNSALAQVNADLTTAQAKVTAANATTATAGLAANVALQAEQAVVTAGTAYVQAVQSRADAASAYSLAQNINPTAQISYWNTVYQYEESVAATAVTAADQGKGTVLGVEGWEALASNAVSAIATLISTVPHGLTDPATIDQTLATGAYNAIVSVLGASGATTGKTIYGQDYVVDNTAFAAFDGSSIASAYASAEAAITQANTITAAAGEVAQLVSLAQQEANTAIAEEAAVAAIADKAAAPVAQNVTEYVVAGSSATTLHIATVLRADGTDLFGTGNNAHYTATITVTTAGHGTVTVDTTDTTANGVPYFTYTPTSGFAGLDSFTYTVTNTDTVTGTISTATGQVTVEVEGATIVAPATVTTVEHAASGFSVSLAVSETIATETVTSVTLSGAPSGSTLSVLPAGATTATTITAVAGVFTLTAAQAAHATITIVPPSDYSGSFTLSAEAYVTDTSLASGVNAHPNTTQTIAVTVTPVTQGATITPSATTVSGTENTAAHPHTVQFTLTVADSHSNEAISSVGFSGVAGTQLAFSGYTVTLGGGGTATITDATEIAALALAPTVTVTPALDTFGAQSLVVSATAANDGAAALTTSQTIHLNLAQVPLAAADVNAASYGAGNTAVSDIASAINGANGAGTTLTGVSYLQHFGISAITITDSGTVTVTALQAEAITFTKTGGGHLEVQDTAADITAAGLATLAAHNVDIIALTDSGTVTLTAAQAHGITLIPGSGHFTVVDTAADINSVTLAALQGIGVNAVTISDSGTVTLTTAQFAALTIPVTLGSGHLQVSGSVGDLNTLGIATLLAAGVSAIGITDANTLTLSAAQAQALTVTKATGAHVAVSDSAANIGADSVLATLLAHGIDQISLTGSGTLALTAAQAAAVTVTHAAGGHASVSDSAANINSATVATLLAHGIDQLSITGTGTVAMTAAQALSLTSLSGTGTVAVSDTTFTSSANLSALAVAVSLASSLTVTSPAILTLNGAEASGKTITGTGAVTISGTLSGSVDLHNIGTSLNLPASIPSGVTLTLSGAEANGLSIGGAGTVALAGTLSGSVDLHGITAALTVPSSVPTGVTLTLSAAQASGQTISGAGTVVISDAAITTNTDLHTITTTGLTLSASVASGVTLTLSGAEASGKTITGTGTVAIVGTLSGSVDLHNFASTVALALPSTVPTGATLTLSAAQASGRTIGGFGTVAIVGSITANTDLHNIGTSLTLPSGLSVPSGDTLTLSAAQANSQVIAGPGTVAIAGSLGGSVDLHNISAALSLPTTVPAGATLTLSVAQVTGRTLTGSGTVVVTGTMTSNLDLSNITAAVTPPASVPSDLTLTLNWAEASGRTIAGPGTVAVVGSLSGSADLHNITATLSLPGSVPSGATLTLSGAQASGQAIAGPGTVAVAGTIGTAVDLHTITAPLVVLASVGSGGSLTLSAAQASGQTIGGAGTVVISGLDGAAAYNLAGITASGGVTATIPATETLNAGTVLGNAVLTVPSGDTLTLRAAQASGHSIGGTGAVVISDLGSAAAYNLSGITASGGVTATISATETLNAGTVLGNAVLTVQPGATLTLSAAQASGHSIGGTGAVVVTGLDGAAAYNLAGIFASGGVTATIPATETLNSGTVLGSAVLTVPSGDTLTLSAAQASGQTIGGTGAVVISDSSISGSIDLSHITTTGLTLPTIASGGSVTLTAAEASGRTISGAGTVVISDSSISGNVDLSHITTTGLTLPGSVAAGGSLTLTAAEASGHTITGAGSVVITGLDGTAAYNLTNVAPTGGATAAVNANVTLDASTMLGGTHVTVGGSYTLTLGAAQASHASITGTGSVAITNLDGNAAYDYSGITASGGVTATVGSNVVLDPGTVLGTAAVGVVYMNTLTLTAAQATGRTITGGGSAVVISDTTISANTDLHAITTTTVTLHTGLSVASGVTLTLSAAEAGGRTINGPGTVAIHDSAIAANTDLHAISAALSFNSALVVDAGDTLTVAAAAVADLPAGLTVASGGHVVAEDGASQLAGLAAAALIAAHVDTLELTGSGTATLSVAQAIAVTTLVPGSGEFDVADAGGAISAQLAKLETEGISHFHVSSGTLALSVAQFDGATFTASGGIVEVADTGGNLGSGAVTSLEGAGVSHFEVVSGTAALSISEAMGGGFVADTGANVEVSGDATTLSTDLASLEHDGVTAVSVTSGALDLTAPQALTAQFSVTGDGVVDVLDIGLNIEAAGLVNIEQHGIQHVTVSDGVLADSSTDLAAFTGELSASTISLTDTAGSVGDSAFQSISCFEELDLHPGNLETVTVTLVDTSVYGRVSAAGAVGAVVVDVSGDTGVATVIGGGGDDTFFTDGHDYIDGGAGSNWIDYANATAGVTVNLATDHGAVSDTLVNIENVIGSAYDDVLTGDAGNNIFEGGGGHDTLIGGGGNDTAVFTGDFADYSFTADGSYVLVTDNRSGSPDGTELLEGITTAQFKDESVAVDTLVPGIAPTTLTALTGVPIALPSGVLDAAASSIVISGLPADAVVALGNTVLTVTNGSVMLTGSQVAEREVLVTLGSAETAALTVSAMMGTGAGETFSTHTVDITAEIGTAHGIGLTDAGTTVTGGSGGDVYVVDASIAGGTVGTVTLADSGGVNVLDVRGIPSYDFAGASEDAATGNLTLELTNGSQLVVDGQFAGANPVISYLITGGDSHPITTFVGYDPADVPATLSGGSGAEVMVLGDNSGIATLKAGSGYDTFFASLTGGQTIIGNEKTVDNSGHSVDGRVEYTMDTSAVTLTAQGATTDASGVGTLDTLSDGTTALRVVGSSIGDYVSVWETSTGALVAGEYNALDQQVAAPTALATLATNQTANMIGIPDVTGEGAFAVEWDSSSGGVEAVSWQSYTFTASGVAADSAVVTVAGDANPNKTTFTSLTDSSGHGTGVAVAWTTPTVSTASTLTINGYAIGVIGDSVSNLISAINADTSATGGVTAAASGQGLILTNGTGGTIAISGTGDFASLTNGALAANGTETLNGNALTVGVEHVQTYALDGTSTGAFTFDPSADNSGTSKPQITGLLDGDLVGLWTPTSGTNAGHLVEQVVDASGTVVAGSTETVAIASTFNLGTIRTTALEDGGFAVTWLQGTTGNYTLSTEAFGATGTPTTTYSEVLASGSIVAFQTTRLVDGDYVVEWVTGSGGSEVVTGQVMTPDGNWTGNEFQMAAANATGLSLSSTHDGGFVSEWSVGTTVYSQSFDAMGRLIQTVTVGGNTDSLFGIDEIVGGSGDDNLTGGPNQTLAGGAGNNTLTGVDSVAGETGVTADYSASPSAVTVNLGAVDGQSEAGGVAADHAANGWGGTDTLTNIFSVVGSAFADTLIAGDSGYYSLDGGGGADILIGGAGTTDFAIGAADDAHVVGGTGLNILEFTEHDGSSAGATFDFTSLAAGRITNIDRIELYNSAVSTIVLDATSVAAIAHGTNLYIDGDASQSATVDLEGNWTRGALFQASNGSYYYAFTSAVETTVIVDVAEGVGVNFTSSFGDTFAVNQTGTVSDLEFLGIGSYSTLEVDHASSVTLGGNAVAAGFTVVDASTDSGNMTINVVDDPGVATLLGGAGNDTFIVAADALSGMTITGTGGYASEVVLSGLATVNSGDFGCDSNIAVVALLDSTSSDSQSVTLGVDAQMAGIGIVDASLTTGAVTVDASAYTNAITLIAGSGAESFFGGTDVDRSDNPTGTVSFAHLTAGVVMAATRVYSSGDGVVEMMSGGGWLGLDTDPNTGQPAIDVFNAEGGSLPTDIGALPGGVTYDALDANGDTLSMQATSGGGAIVAAEWSATTPGDGHGTLGWVDVGADGTLHTVSNTTDDGAATVTGLSNGNVLAGWFDGTSRDFTWELFTADGTAIQVGGTDMQTVAGISDIGGGLDAAVPVALAGGGFALVEAPNDGTLVVQEFDSAGALLTSFGTGGTSADISGDQAHAVTQAVQLAGGGLAVLWEDGNTNAHVTLVSADGGSSTELALPDGGSAEFEGDQEIVALAGGGFVVAGKDWNPSGEYVVAQVYNADGSFGQSIILDTDNDDHLASLKALANGDFAATTGVSGDYYTVVYQPDGTMIDATATVSGSGVVDDLTNVVAVVGTRYADVLTDPGYDSTVTYTLDGGGGADTLIGRAGVYTLFIEEGAPAAGLTVEGGGSDNLMLVNPGTVTDDQLQNVTGVSALELSDSGPGATTTVYLGGNAAEAGITNIGAGITLGTVTVDASQEDTAVTLWVGSGTGIDTLLTGSAHGTIENGNATNLSLADFTITADGGGVTVTSVDGTYVLEGDGTLAFADGANPLQVATVDGATTLTAGPSDTFTVGSGFATITMSAGTDTLVTTSAVLTGGTVVVGNSSGTDTVELTDSGTFGDSLFAGLTDIATLALAGTGAMSLTLGDDAAAAGIHTINLGATSGAVTVDVRHDSAVATIDGGTGADTFVVSSQSPTVHVVGNASGTNILALGDGGGGGIVPEAHTFDFTGVGGAGAVSGFTGLVEGQFSNIEYVSPGAGVTTIILDVASVQAMAENGYLGITGSGVIELAGSGWENGSPGTFSAGGVNVVAENWKVGYVDQWVGGGSGSGISWGADPAADWSTGVVPGQYDFVQVTDECWITYDTGTSATVQGFSVGGFAELEISDGTLTVTGDATVSPNSASLALDGGTLSIGGTVYDYGDFQFTGGILAGAGTLEVLGTAEFSGSAELDGTLLLDPTGARVTLDGVSITGTGTLINAGADHTAEYGPDDSLYVSDDGATIDPTFVNLAGAQATVTSGVTFGGDVINLGLLELSNAGYATSVAGMLVNSGEIDFGDGSSLTAGVVDNAGDIEVTGSFTVQSPDVISSGSINLVPETSDLLFTVDGNVTLAAASSLGVNLASYHSELVVDGTAHLDGTLAVTAFDPTGTYTVVSATGGITGAFTAMTGMSDYETWLLDPQYSNGSLTLTVRSYTVDFGNNDVAGRYLIANAGSDILDGTGQVGDVLLGRAGDDTFKIDNNQYHLIDGGGGSNTVELHFGGTVDLTAGGGLMENIQDIHLMSESTNLVLSAADVATIASGGPLTITGDDSEHVTLEGAWTYEGTNTDGDGVWQSSTSSALVDVASGITVVDNVYTFAGLTAGNIGGQDGWATYDNSDGGGYYYSWLDTIGTSTIAGYNDGVTALVLGSAPNEGAQIARLAGGTLDMPTLAPGEVVTLQYDFVPNYWGATFQIGSAGTAAGLFATGAAEAGASYATNGNVAELIDAEGNVTSASLVLTGGTTWYSFRVVYDLAADGGHGDMSLYYRDDTDSGAWTAVAGLQDIALNANWSGSGAADPADWNGIMLTAGNGEALLANISYSVFMPSNPVPMVNGGQLAALVTTGDGVAYSVLGGTDVSGITTFTTAHGTVTLTDGTGAFTYLASGNYAGLDSFQWRVTDTTTGAQTAVETATVVAVQAAETVTGDWGSTPDEAVVNAAIGVLDSMDQATYLDVTESGSLTVANIETLDCGGVVEAGGMFTLSGGTLEMGSAAAALTVAGTLVLDGGTIDASATVVVDGALTYDNATTVNGILDLDIATTLASITITGSGELINDGYLTVMGTDIIDPVLVNHAGATLLLDAGNAPWLTATIDNQGTLTTDANGGDIIGDVHSTGILAPNGHLAITGDLALGDSSVVEVGLTHSGWDSGIDVSGVVSVDQSDSGGGPTLAVTADDILAGDQFAVLTWGHGSGDSWGQGLPEFAAMTGMADTANGDWVLDPVYSDNALTLVAQATDDQSVSTGVFKGDYMVAQAGGDTLIGAFTGNDNDVLIGQGGNDTFQINSTHFDLIDGGGGVNTLDWTGGTTLDLSQFGMTPTASTQLIENIQAIDLVTSNTTLQLDLSHVVQMGAGGNTATEALFGNQPTVVIIGNSTDSVYLPGTGWTQGATTPTTGAGAVDIPNHTGESYTVYSNGSAHVLVDSAISSANVHTNMGMPGGGGEVTH